MIREHLIRESIDLTTGLDLKGVFDQIIDEINTTNLSDMPGGQELINTINQYSDEVDRLEASGQQVDIESKLTKLFQFNSDYVNLKDKAIPFYKYSPGNAALLAIQGAPNQILATIGWWNARGMKLKPEADFKVILRPIFNENTTNDYTENIEGELNKTYPYEKVKSAVKDKISANGGSSIQDTETFTGAELYNLWNNRPKDADVSSLLDTMEGRNELSRFMLTAFGLKSSEKSQGYKLGYLYPRDQVIPKDVKLQAHPEINKRYEEDDIQTAEALVADIVGGFTELSAKENEIESVADETGMALFHDVIDEIKKITSFEGDEESNMRFFQTLLTLNDKIDTIRRNQGTYQYTTRNLLLLAMQAKNLTQVGARTYWYIQGKAPKRGAHGKVILTPITDEDPQKVAHDVVNRTITANLVKKDGMVYRKFLKLGITFTDADEREYNVAQLFNLLNNRPMDADVESLIGWEFLIARFYLELTGLKRHLTKGYHIAIIYDITDVEPIPGVETFDRLVEPTIADIRYDGNPSKLEAIRKTVSELLTELRSNPSLKTAKDAQTAIANKCLYHNDVIPAEYKTPAVLTGRGKQRDAALYDFNLMRNEPADNENNSNLIAEIGRLLHLMVHEVAHYNRGELSSDYAGNPKSQADIIYHEFLDLKPGQRIYYNPNNPDDQKRLATQIAVKQIGANAWRQLSPEDQKRRISAIIAKEGIKSGLVTSYSEKGRYYRETQAEIITGMIMKALQIPTKLVGNNLALLTNAGVEKDKENIPTHEVQFFMDTANAILRKIHSKLDSLDESHKSLKTMIEQILNNKDLLTL